MHHHHYVHHLRADVWFRKIHHHRHWSFIVMNPISTTAPVQAIFTLTDNGTPLTPDAVAWASGNTDVATVDAAGVVTPVAVGNVNITGTATGTITHGSVTTPYEILAVGLVSVTQVGDNLVATVDFQPIP